MLRGGASAPLQRSTSGTAPSNIRESIVQRLMLSTQVGNVSNGSGRVEQRSREEMQQFMGRGFPSGTFQPTQVSSEVMDMWSNVLGTENFSSFSNGSSAYGSSAPTLYLPNMLNLPPLPPVFLRCPECGICKMSSEEMEVHIKVEHLHWSPFQCTECLAERSTDFQLREHVHSTHRKSYELHQKYIYVYHDNPTAKRLLQLMMDRCLMTARRVQSSSLVGSSEPSPTVTTATSAPYFHSSTCLTNNLRERFVNQTTDVDKRSSSSVSPPRESVTENPMRNISLLTNGRDPGAVNQQRSGFPSGAAIGATATVIPKKRATSAENAISWNTNTDAVLSAIRVATHENVGEQDGVIEGSGTEDRTEGGEVDSEYINIASSRHEVKNAFDVPMDQSTVEQSDEALLTAMALEAANHDTTEILGNVAAIFSAEGVSSQWKQRSRRTSSHASADGVSSSIKNERRRATKSSLAKRRMMGICKCKQLITAGARQMHVFYHMARDRQLYRFRCKYPGCQVQHYRKDQMENHQSKVHGAINPMLIQDRTAELFKISQEVSMDLLGTTGNKPGPTAVRAQMIYDSMASRRTRNPRTTRKRKRTVDKASPVETDQVTSFAVDATLCKASKIPVAQENQCGIAEDYQNYQQEQELIHSVPSTSDAVPLTEPDDDHQLHCQKCERPIRNKVRGFHVLWHLSKDLGINRYICKFCGFGHDRKQVVVSHGKREHNIEDCCEDRVEEYSDEVRAVTEQCFGLQSKSPHDTHLQNKAVQPSSEAVSEMQATTDTMENDAPAITTSEENEDATICSSDDNDANASVPSHATELMQPAQLQVESSVESTMPRLHASTSSYRDRMRKARNRRFGIRKLPSRLKRKEMAKLREISMRLGGAQYFKKRFNEAAHCQKCGVLTTSRLSDHAYKHLDVQLFLCPQCDIGNQSRDLVVKHIRDIHNSQEHPIDERWKYRVEIKEIIRECYPAKQSLSSGRFFDVIGTTDDDQTESVDAIPEQDGIGEADSDDDHQEGIENAVDDQTQERFVMENDHDQLADGDTSSDDAIAELNENDGGESACSSFERSSSSRILQNERLVGNRRTEVKNESDDRSDLSEVEIVHSAEDEEEEEM
ncbi:unnamed protein product [Thelazia callipaeda]|uniref:C2H2-type domain-containing protein n=1 Tax=Thelazia callipaeda TaxID=103827 RepID=A0A0N5D8M8_THECL|nr:unnamed protein product [Thelazia callipaeda]